MNLIEVVLLAGVQCMSPVQPAEGTTVLGKVPCAVLIRLDEDTGDVDFTPPSAASNREVIALLVKTDDVEVPAIPEPEEDTTAEGDAQDLPVAPKPQAREKSEEKPVKTPERRKTAAAKRKRVSQRNDSCGSYKAVWYTNKQGRRKYRCVRSG